MTDTRNTEKNNKKGNKKGMRLGLEFNPKKNKTTTNGSNIHFAIAGFKFMWIIPCKKTIKKIM